MSITLVVEDGTNVAGANSYVDLTYARTYAESVGLVLPAADEALKVVLLAAMTYIEGQEELGSFLISFSDEMPFIPLLYRKGMICFTKAMNGNVEGTLNDCFINIENWYFESE